MAKKTVGYFGTRPGMSVGKRAGKSKASAAKRKEQNKGVASGEIRKGAKGKGYNVYDAKTGTWKKLKTQGGSGSGTYKGDKAAASKTTRVSPSRRGEGAATKMGQVTRATGGYMRGGAVGKEQSRLAAERLKRQTGRSTLRGARIAKRAEDTRNQGRNAAVIASIPLAAAGAAGVGAAVGRSGIAAAGRLAGEGARQGVRQYGKEATRRAAATARAAASKPATSRSAAAQKGWATRRANAAKKGAEGPKGRKR